MLRSLMTFLWVALFMPCSVKAIPLKTVEFGLNIQVQIYQPDRSIEHDQKRFPTLYIMDGQHFIYSAIGYQKSLNWRNASSPQFIVVAIDTSKIGDASVQRRDLLNKDSSSLINIIENEIIPHVNAHYPSSAVRLFAGWEHAGGFALDILTTRPQLFDAFLIASSPNISTERLYRIEQLFEDPARNSDRLNKRLYLALGGQENYAFDGFSQLHQFGQAYSSHLQTHYNVSPELSHFTTPIDLFTKGLAWIFADYPAVNFYDIHDLRAFGGVPAVKDYFVKRSQRYHVSSAVAENTKFTMARHAVDAHDFSLFMAIEDELGKLDHEAFPPYWAHFFVSFLVDHNHFERAEEIMHSALSRHPEVTQLIELNEHLKMKKEGVE